MKLSEVDAALDQYGWRASCRPNGSGGWVWIGTSKAEPHSTVSAPSGEALVAAVRFLSEPLSGGGERDDEDIRVILENQAADDRRQREYDRRHSERPPLF